MTRTLIRRPPDPFSAGEILRQRTACSMCGALIAHDRLHPVTIGRSTSWWCRRCWERHERRAEAGA